MEKEDPRLAAFIDSPIRVGSEANGIELRPITHTSYRLLTETGSPMATGSLDGEDDLAAIAALQEFIFIHGGNLRDVVRCVRDGSFRDEAMLFCAQFSPDEINDAAEEIGAAGEAVQVASAEPIPEPGKTQPQPVLSHAG